jgi:glutamine synthetase
MQLQKYLSLDQKGSIIAEYVWIDGSGGIRSKSKVSSTSIPINYTIATCLAP